MEATQLRAPGFSRLGIHGDEHRHYYGFRYADFAAWEAGAQITLVFLMFVGGCAGSTAGGIK